MHQGCGCSNETIAYATQHVRTGAEQAGRDADELDIGAMVFTAIAPDSGRLRGRRTVVAFYVSALPREHLERHGIDLDELQPIMAAVEAGEIEPAIELTPIELADKLCLFGSPEEWCSASAKA